jgi:HEAT repeat protein
MYQGRPMSEWLEQSADADLVGTATPAFHALAAIGEPAVQPLIDRLSSEESRVRLGAYMALSDFCPDVLPRLRGALSRARDTSRFYLTHAIDNIRQYAAANPDECT